MCSQQSVYSRAPTPKLRYMVFPLFNEYILISPPSFTPVGATTSSTMSVRPNHVTKAMSAKRLGIPSTATCDPLRSVRTELNSFTNVFEENLAQHPQVP